jgi:hypothetical protein
MLIVAIRTLAGALGGRLPRYRVKSAAAGTEAATRLFSSPVELG